MANFQPPSALNECLAKLSVSDMNQAAEYPATLKNTRYPMGMPRPVPRTMLGANDIVRRAQQSARRAQESARRAQESARRAQESALCVPESARRAQESALRVQESARRVQESALCTQLNALSAKDITP